jgi:hypothetical protein
MKRLGAVAQAMGRSLSTRAPEARPEVAIAL